jgi:hypothetical protein
MEEVLYWLVRWVCRAGTRHFFLPWLLQSAQYKNIFSLTVNHFDSIPALLRDRQPSIAGSLSLSVCLWRETTVLFICKSLWVTTRVADPHSLDPDPGF